MSLLSTYLLIHLSAHLYYHHHSHHPSLLHYFSPGSKPTFSTNPYSPLRLLLPTGLPSWQRDWTGPIMLIVLFLVSHFNFLFVPCGELSWLPVSFLLHVKYTLSYRIVQAKLQNTAFWVISVSGDANYDDTVHWLPVTTRQQSSHCPVVAVYNCTVTQKTLSSGVSATGLDIGSTTKGKETWTE